MLESNIEIFALLRIGSWVQLHPLTHAQFISKAHRPETKFEKGASDRNSLPVRGFTIYGCTNKQGSLTSETVQPTPAQIGSGYSAALLECACCAKVLHVCGV